MADLDKSGIVTAATIQPSHITDVYDVLTGDKVFDNTNSLVGGIKEFSALLSADSHGWNILSEHFNSTGSSVTIEQGVDSHFSLMFPTFNVIDYDDRMHLYTTMDWGSVDEWKYILFALSIGGDHSIDIYPYDLAGNSVNIPADVPDSFYFNIRLLFYP